MFESYLRVVSIDYPETSCENISKFREFSSFFSKENKKIRKKIHLFGQIDKSIFAEKV